jgi:hypothetical protein
MEAPQNRRFYGKITSLPSALCFDKAHCPTILLGTLGRGLKRGDFKNILTLPKMKGKRNQTNIEAIQSRKGLKLTLDQ